MVKAVGRASEYYFVIFNVVSNEIRNFGKGATEHNGQNSNDFERASDCRGGDFIIK